MDHGAIPLCRIFGIRISFSLSWLLAFALVWLGLSGAYLPAHYPEWPVAVRWVAGFAASLLFFLCVVLHELAHSLVALRNGLPVRGITLFVLGGVSHLGRDVPGPRAEFAIAVAGPLASVLLGLAAGALGRILGPLNRPIGDLLTWLAILNVGLGLFNLLPGFPLDGGRVLRSLVWFAADDFTWATRVATRAGQLAALTMALAGVWLLVEQRRSAFGSGVWLILIGWFLFGAAGASYHSALAMHALRGLLVRDLMRHSPLKIDADAPLQGLGAAFLARPAGEPAIVVRGERPVGLIGPAALGRYLPQQLEFMRAGEAMAPLRPNQLLPADLPAAEALQALIAGGDESLPVLSGGELCGLLRQDDLFRAMELRRRFGG